MKKRQKIGLRLILSALLVSACAAEKVPVISESHECWYTDQNSDSILMDGVLWTPTLDHHAILRMNTITGESEIWDFASEQALGEIKIRRITVVNERYFAIWLTASSDSTLPIAAKEFYFLEDESFIPAAVVIWDRSAGEIRDILKVPLGAVVHGINAYVITDNILRRIVLSQGFAINENSFWDRVEGGEKVEVVSAVDKRLILQVRAGNSEKETNSSEQRYWIWNFASRLPDQWIEISFIPDFGAERASVEYIGNRDNELFFQTQNETGTLVFQAGADGIGQIQELGSLANSQVCISETGYYYGTVLSAQSGTRAPGLLLMRKQGAETVVISEFQDGVSDEISPLGGYLLVQVQMENGQIQQFLIHPATKEKLCLQESSEAKVN